MKIGDLVTFARWSSPSVHIGILLFSEKGEFGPGYAVVRWLIGSLSGQEKVHALNEVEKLYYNF
jgi:hypothetical protein